MNRTLEVSVNKLSCQNRILNNVRIIIYDQIFGILKLVLKRPEALELFQLII